MSTITRSLLAAGLIALGLPAVPAHAQLARTFVSAAGGNDGNDCSRTTPCRTFQRAHDNTAGGGEIAVLDPGGYGAVTITKSIAIVNDGVGEAGVLVSGGVNGITVNAGAADSVSLHGLTVKGIGFGGGNGIVFINGKSLTVDQCAIRNLTGGNPIGVGILFEPGGSSSLAVSNTLVTDNGFIGVEVNPTAASASVQATFTRFEAYGNADDGIAIFGSNMTGSLDAIVADSVSANNGSNGFGAASTRAATSLMLVRSVSTNNFRGLFALGGVTVRVGESMLAGNSKTFAQEVGAVVASYGDNNIDGNADGNPAPAVIPKR